MRIIFLLIISLALYGDLATFIQSTKESAKCFRQDATKRLDRFLYGLDSYFSDSKDINRSSYRKIRKSRLLVILSIKDSQKFNLHLRGKIHLPQLKNSTELTFSQNDKEEMDNQNSIKKNDDIIKDKSFRVGLKYYLYKNRKRMAQAYAKINMKLGGSSFGPYLKFGVDRTFIDRDFFQTDVNNALYYYINGNEISASTAISFYKPLSNIYQIGQGNKLYWEDDTFYLDNSILLYQTLDLNNRMIYKIEYTTSYDDKDGFEHSNFEISSGYFHRFDKWFFAEIIPKYRKNRDKHYKDEILFTLNFGMLLGHH